MFGAFVDDAVLGVIIGSVVGIVSGIFDIDGKQLIVIIFAGFVIYLCCEVAIPFINIFQICGIPKCSIFSADNDLIQFLGESFGDIATHIYIELFYPIGWFFCSWFIGRFASELFGKQEGLE